MFVIVAGFLPLCSDKTPTTRAKRGGMRGDACGGVLTYTLSDFFTKTTGRPLEVTLRLELRTTEYKSVVLPIETMRPVGTQPPLRSDHVIKGLNSS